MSGAGLVNSKVMKKAMKSAYWLAEYLAIQSAAYLVMWEKEMEVKTDWQMEVVTGSQVLVLGPSFPFEAKNVEKYKERERVIKRK